MIKTNKHLLLMQMLAISPLALFLLIYIKIYTLPIVLLLLLLFNVYRHIQKLPLVQYPLILVLVVSFLVYSLYNLGSREAPQTFVDFNSDNNSAFFKFDGEKQVDKLCFYKGIGNYGKFALSYLSGQTFKSFYKYDADFPYSFRWECTDIDIQTSEIRLDLSEGQLMMGEIRFLYHGLIRDNIPVKIKTDNALLNDELNLMADKSYYGSTYFDEIYHVRAAYEMLHGKNVFESSHPNLGKMLIVPGIVAFDMTPFGWRISNVVFAALFIIVFYYFSLSLFKSEFFAFSGSLMLTYSFMHFSQARIGLIDTFGVFFVFCAYYLLYRFIIKQQLSPLLLSGLFFGLAVSVKWSAAFAVIGFFCIALYLLWLRYPLAERFSGYKLIAYGFLSYAVLAITVYILSFYNYYIETWSLKPVYWHQLTMFNYHSQLKATHIYSSSWWTWPLNIQPIFYAREIKDALLSSIAAFGNPAIFWLGIVAIAYLLSVVLRKRSLEAMLILSAFLGLYLPYAVVGRIMFIYHFYYALPFMILALVYFWRDLILYSSRFYVLFYFFLIIVIVLFLFFYPVISGYKVSLPYVVDYFYWFKAWRF